MDRRPNRDLERPAGRPLCRDEARPERRSEGAQERGIGVDAGAMNPRAQVATSLALLVPLVGGYLAVLALFPWMWWLVFVSGWAVFPAFGLLVRGAAGLSEGGGRTSHASGGEREILRTLREHGELAPAQAAVENSLTVDRRTGCCVNWRRPVLRAVVAGRAGFASVLSGVFGVLLRGGHGVSFKTQKGL